MVKFPNKLWIFVESGKGSTPVKKKAFLAGLRDAIPVGLGYLTVSFGVGIACRTAQLNAFQGLLLSLLGNASAGEYAAITVIAEGGSVLTMILMMIVANARYLLMGCALSQKLSPGLPLGHRLLIGFDLTDELFGLAIAQPGYLEPSYYYGEMCASIPFWSLGTVLGIVLGALMPERLASGFSVMLFGMFLAVIVPPAKKDRVVLGCVLVSFLLSWLFQNLPWVSGWSGGLQTIVLTVLIAGAAALLFPRKEEAQ